METTPPPEVEVSETPSGNENAHSRTTGPTEPSIDPSGQPNKSLITVDLRAKHRELLRILTTLILVALLAEWIVLTTQRPAPLPIRRGPNYLHQFQVEINSATWVEWLQLEGIGPSLAHRIVADRKLNGPFASVDELTRVPGIGPATLDRIRGWLTIRHDFSDANLSEAISSERSARQPANDQRQSPAF